MTVREALAEATLYIPRRDAELLLAHTAERSRAWLLAYPEAALDPDILAGFNTLVRRRDAGEPVQHLTGQQEFFGLALQVSPAVLIPRPETEHLVEEVLGWARAHPSPTLRMADVGTGSGAIALALAANLPDADIVAVDLSTRALAVARGNADRLHLSHRVRFLESDLLSAVTSGARMGGNFDVVASNPPYVAETDAPTLAPEVRDHEPALALYGGTDGLAVYRRLIPQARTALRSGGLLALEIGFGQRIALEELLQGWSEVRFVEDYAGIPRVGLAVRA
ncbi:MAG TPA: peptide chain release factor N(5)-glutamine methyltransferase [Acidobacteriaceae bacterium]|jgi:release factor glutamine methyltransferase|nr:peptide chain release factor N(5)-glutamine methyltransferase [Acidobacteriaceae bacterium]